MPVTRFMNLYIFLSECTEVGYLLDSGKKVYKPTDCLFWRGGFLLDAGFFWAAGSSTIKVEPKPGSLSHRTVPFIVLLIFFTIYKPSPVDDSLPVGLLLNFENLPNSFFLSDSEIPGP